MCKCGKPTKMTPAEMTGEATRIGCLLSEINTLAKVAMVNADEQDIAPLLNTIGRLAALGEQMADEMERRLMV